MNIDILAALGEDSSSGKSYGEKLFESGLAGLRNKYPTLTGSGSLHIRKDKRKRSSSSGAASSNAVVGIGFGTSTSTNDPADNDVDVNAESSFLKYLKPSASSRTCVDLSGSKLCELDGPGFTVQPRIGRRVQKAIKKKARDRTKGPQWFDMTAPEITDERKNDLEALQLRSALDTKTFYKRNSVPIKPKHFQVGRIIETPADFYNSRVPKKQRKRTIAEEFMSELNE